MSAHKSGETERRRNGCRPTCMELGPYHAFDCPNHPGVRPSKHQHPNCSDCRHERASA